MGVKRKMERLVPCYGAGCGGLCPLIRATRADPSLLDVIRFVLCQHNRRILTERTTATYIHIRLEVFIAQPLDRHTWREVVEQIKAFYPHVEIRAEGSRMVVVSSLPDPPRPSWDSKRCGPLEVFLGMGDRPVVVSLAAHPLVIVLAPDEPGRELLMAAVYSLAYSTPPTVAIRTNLPVNIPHPSQTAPQIVSVFHRPPRGMAFHLAEIGKAIISFPPNACPDWDALLIDYKNGFRIWRRIGLPEPFVPPVVDPIAASRAVFERWTSDDSPTGYTLRR